MSRRTAALADAFENDLHFEADAVDDCDNEVYIKVEEYGVGALTGMDRVCAIAYDHGFVPVGITETGASRFKPRDSDEV